MRSLGNAKNNVLSGIVEYWTENYFPDLLRKDERAKSETSLQINLLSLALDMKAPLIPPWYCPFVYSSPVTVIHFVFLYMLYCNLSRVFCC